MKQWQCFFCGYMYDEAVGDAAHGFPPGTAWADIPDDWCCPECGATKSDFAMIEIE
jgi:rubredoxin